MLLGYIYAETKINNYNKSPRPPAILIAMAVRRCNTKRITQCSMTRVSPKATGCCHRATTDYVLAQQSPGWQSTKRQCKVHLLCWPFWWPLWCTGTIPQGGGSWLSKKPLNAAIGQALTPIGINRTFQRRLFLTFHHEKGLELTCWPLITIGVWHTKLIIST